MKLSDLKEGSTGQEAVLIYGGPKMGKTTFAATFPTPIFIADFDGGVTSVIGHPKSDEIEFETFFDPDPESPQPVYRWEDRVKSFWDTYRQNGSWPFRTVVLDSATLFLKALMNKAFQQTVASKDAELKRVLGVAPARGHWNVQMAYFDQEVRRLLAMPCYKVLICHEDTSEPYRIRPMLTGKQKEGIYPLFSEIYHMESVGEEGQRVFVVRLRPSDTAFAGSRLDHKGLIGELYRWTDLTTGRPIWDAFQRMLKIWGGEA
ncbi:MAG: ATP-binding protein [Dehalococcoidia bacterium]|nr:ATP-binding protein [Dehalococcoidia bacterium]